MSVVPVSVTAVQARPWQGQAYNAGRRNAASSPVCRGLVRPAAVAFSIATTVGLWLVFLGRGAPGQTTAKPSFWTGKLEVTVLRCGEECGPYQVDDKGIARHDPKDLVSRYTYKVYQNDKGIVRHQLIDANPAGVNEQGRGGQILDYSAGYSVVFDPGLSQALRGPLIFPNTTSTPLEGRKIVGLKCNGVRRTWVQVRNRFRNVRESWTAADIDFRDPIFEVFYGYDASGGLGLVEVKVIGSIKPSPPLDPPLFELPPGMGVIDMGNP